MPFLPEQYLNAELVSIGVAPAREQGFGFDLIDWVRFLNFKSSEKYATANISLIDATAAALVFQMDDGEIADGACLSPFVATTSNIQIGRCSRADLDTCIELDCLISEFVTFAPGTEANHNATIGGHGYIGSDSVFIRDVPPAITVVSDPATQLIKD